MGYFDRDAQEARLKAILPTHPSQYRLRTKLFLALIPAVLCVIAATGWVGYKISDSFVHVGVERMTRVVTLSMAHALEEYLEDCRADLVYVAQDPLTPANMRAFLERNRRAGGPSYVEFGLALKNDPDAVLLVSDGTRVLDLKRERLAEIRGGPTKLYDVMSQAPPGEARIFPIEEVEFPFPEQADMGRRLSRKLIRMAVPYAPAGEVLGFAFLSVDARDLRNILSVYNSADSPIAAFQRSPEFRYAFFFDPDGWMLFQSEDPKNKTTELSTHAARSGYSGVLGKPDLRSAFRPNPNWINYWKMVVDVGENRADLLRLVDAEFLPDAVGEFFLSYAPVRFRASKEKPPVVYGGLAYLDRSRLPTTAGYRHIDALFITVLAAMCFIAAIIYFVGKAAGKHIFALAEAVRALRISGKLTPIELKGGGYETTVLLEAINHMIALVNRQMVEIKAKDQAIECVQKKEEADLGAEAPTLARDLDDHDAPGVIGGGARIDALRADIAKASKADVDLLIVGETGTGKQLVAEAVHHLSARRDKPFIAINCGALDETLLLDTLFGHVKGAFTEAKTDRKGAFLEADGGVLFLDEIQAASPRVQQSLLRAVAARRITPLGSDRELNVDVRLFAATNVDLKALIEKGEFREDLFFRLNVLVLSTPPLREHKENIPAIGYYYLKKAEKLVKKERLALSKGALAKLRDHDWPGNVRELKNAVTRAVVMTEGHVIQAEDILLDAGELAPTPPRGAETVEAPITPRSADRTAQRRPEARLNPRQERAWPFILEKGDVTRLEYERLVGGDVPARTAVYDLQDFVKKGLLMKAGMGPATRYIVVSARKN